MTIYTPSSSERTRVARRLLMEAASGEEIYLDGEPCDKIMLLPIPLSRDGIHLTDSNTQLRELREQLCECDLAVGYGSLLLDSAPSRYLDLSKDERFIQRNTDISAIGALAHILAKSPEAVSDMTVGIIGYGRLGKAMVKYLCFLGANLIVYTSSKTSAEELIALGIHTEKIDYDGERESSFTGLDALINTAPRRICSASVAERLAKQMRVICLASGSTFDSSEAVERLPSIPERMYPISAARAYYDATVRYIRSCGGVLPREDVI